MARITRRQLKRNELAESFGRTVDYVSHHRRGATEAIAAAVAVLLLAAGFFLFRGWRERSAGRELSEALAILEAPLASDPAAATAARTFPSAADREREASRHLDAAAKKGGTEAGRAARVIVAVRSEKPAEAVNVLTKVARDAQMDVAAAAEIGAARLLAASGKTTEAIDRLKRGIESPQSAAPKDALLFVLAETYEKAGAAADARATYQRLVNDYPNSPYRTEARTKLGAAQ
jgi:tetratricopeptide (TPR) repeat protein